MAADSAPSTVLDLVERFERNLSACGHAQADRNEYTSGKYNEAQLRNEFLDPFFESLGWDVNNRQGYAEAYKDVIHEDAIRIGGATKAPDYCFRMGGAGHAFGRAGRPFAGAKMLAGFVLDLPQTEDYIDLRTRGEM